MADYVNETFEGEVELDGNTYRNCTFDKVTFIYGGGTLNMDNCQFGEFGFFFKDQLANGLFALYQLFGKEGLLNLIGALVDRAEQAGAQGQA